MSGKRALPVARLELEAEAPDKPALGAPCNGCGVCCMAEPCPLGILVTRTTTGPCACLEWSAPERRYRCGLIAHPERHMRIGASMLARWAPRFVSAGRGCDSDVEITREAL